MRIEAVLQGIGVTKSDRSHRTAVPCRKDFETTLAEAFEKQRRNNENIRKLSEKYGSGKFY